MKLKFVDLFCGAGGVTTGIEQARFKGNKIAEVIACVNHDPNAIASHYANYPDVHHFTEDIRTLKIKPLIELVIKNRNADDLICLWASLECTNFSKAKGGKPRDADSRTLANDLFRYIDGINPDFIFIENVEEFMSWGPLDENGKPKDKLQGEDYIRWIENVKKRGYHYDYRLLNSADYGAHTSRKRFFGVFAKHGLPIQFPQPTHVKNPTKGIFGTLEKWKPVKEVLEFDVKGESIFTRKKPLSENTLKRIHAGLVKYVAGGKQAFLTKHFSSHNNTKLNSGADIDESAPTVTTQGRIGLVQPAFIQKYNSNNAKTGINNGASIEEPNPVVTTQGRLALVQPAFLNKYHGNGDNILSVEDTCSTLSTKDRLALVQPEYFISKAYSGPANHQSIDNPAGTIMSNDKHSLVSCFVLNPQYSSNGASIEKPCFTLIARMDKAPPYLIQTEKGEIGIEVYESDSETMRKIKEFMSLYGIIDIKMRMLLVLELLRIQGFHENYILKGTQADHKKFIGNSVVPLMAQRLIEAIYAGMKIENRRIA